MVQVLDFSRVLRKDAIHMPRTLFMTKGYPLKLYLSVGYYSARLHSIRLSILIMQD